MELDDRIRQSTNNLGFLADPVLPTLINHTHREQDAVCKGIQLCVSYVTSSREREGNHIDLKVQTQVLWCYVNDVCM